MMGSTGTRKWLASLTAMSFLWAACGDDEVETKPPTIVKFSADTQTVTSGGKVTLTYEVSDANSVKITAVPGGDLTLPGGLKGSVDSAALTANTKFTLTATGDGGNASKSIDITVQAASTVTIVAFTANPTTIQPGQSSTLSWTVQNAATVKITDGSGASVYDGTDQSGTRSVTPAATTTYTLTVTGEGGPKTGTQTVTVSAVSMVPNITTFSATPNPVVAGNTAILAWAVENATNVKITDGAGGTVYDGANLTGSQNVTPATTTVYTLTAKNAANETDTETVTLTVNPVQTGAEIVAFTANPATIDLGASTTLSWEVRNAPGGIEISQGANLLYSSANLTGTFLATPAAAGTVSYQLKAKNANGDATNTVMVTVNNALPTITSFTATPPSVAPGGQSTLAWVVSRATRVRVLDGATVVFDDINVTSGSGSVNVTVAATTTYTLEASNISGNVTQTVTVTAVEAPVLSIDEFIVVPTSFVGAATATVTWQTTAATSTQLWVEGVAVGGFPGGASGTYSWTVTRSVDVRLSATDGTTTVYSPIAYIGAIVPKNPTNTSSTSPMAVLGDGTGYAGTILVDGEADWYSVDVPAGYGLVAYTECDVDTQLRVLDSNMNEVAYNDDINYPSNACSSVDPVKNAGLRNLAAGTYFVRVNGYAANTGTYTVFIRVVAPACGDGVLQTLAGESCDDGNLNSNDGCSGTCVFEGLLESEPNDSSATADVLTPPEMAAGSLDPLNGDASDWYAITVPAGYSMAAMVGIDRINACPSGALAILTLYDTDGTTILGTSATGRGTGACAAFLPDSAPTNSMAGGTYYIAVTEEDDDDLVGRYFLGVDLIAPACGNNLVEGIETCDDGNTVAGDGCDALCNLEAAGVATGPSATPFEYNRSLAAGAADLFRVEMTSAGYIRAETFAPTAPDCDSDTYLRLLDANMQVLATNDEGGLNSCSLIDPESTPAAAVDAGVYYVEVTEYFGDALPAYQLVLNLLGQGCNNGILEGTEQCDDGNNISGDGCSDTCQFEGSPETEPNNTAATANVATAPGAFTGALDPAATDEVDFWAVTVPAGYSLVAGVATDGNGGCANESVSLSLYDVDGTTVLAENSYDGADFNCGLISPETTTAARGMAGGTYYLSVWPTEGFAIPGYYLNIDLVAPACGNGIVDGNDACDDGNVVDGDGCDATCNVEVIDVYSFPTPGGQAIFTEAIDPADQLDFYRLDVASPMFLSAQTFTDVNLGECTEDTVMRLYNSTRDEILSDDQDGVDSCSRFFPTDQGALLQPGTYYISVESWFGFSVISSYDLVIEGKAPEICGNDVTEPTVNEQCDDGNTSDGDGCSATCQWESLGTFQAPGGNGTAQIPAGAYRLFTLTVGIDGESVAIQTGDAADTSVCSTDTSLFLIDANSLLVAQAADGAAGDCAALNQTNMQAGTYYIAITNDTVTDADIGIDVAFTTPACGNGTTETLQGETCDDGNNVDNDGCSATCQFEGLSETEPNNDPFGATPTFNDVGLVGPGTKIVVGVLPAGVGERDFFKVTVPAGQTLSLSASTYQDPSHPNDPCPPGTIDTAVKIWNAIGDELAFVDDNHWPNDLCSAVLASGLTDGDYYVSVANWEFEYDGSARDPADPDMTYYVSINLQ